MDNELLKKVFHICRHIGRMSTVSNLFTKPVNCGSAISETVILIGGIEEFKIICGNDNKDCDAEPFMLIPCPEKKGEI